MRRHYNRVTCLLYESPEVRLPGILRFCGTRDGSKPPTDLTPPRHGAPHRIRRRFSHRRKRRSRSEVSTAGESSLAVRSAPSRPSTLAPTKVVSRQRNIRSLGLPFAPDLTSSKVRGGAQNGGSQVERTLERLHGTSIPTASPAAEFRSKPPTGARSSLRPCSDRPDPAEAASPPGEEGG